MLCVSLGCGKSDVVEIQVRGSDSEVNLVQRVAEAYMETHPEVSIAVTGGGSGVGIAALLDGTADLANSSRPLKATEKLLAIRKGITPTATLFATDALTVVVHKDNPVTKMSLTDIGEMYRGEVSSWSDHGFDAPVVTYGRQSSSGTASFFKKAVVEGEYRDDMRAMSGSGQIVEAVARDPGGIGYVAVGYLRAGAKGIVAVHILDEGTGDYVDPLDQSAVLAGRYPVARPLYQYSNGVPSGVLKDFLTFELSPAGVAIADEMGFYPLTDAWRAQNTHLEAP